MSMGVPVLTQHLFGLPWLVSKDFDLGGTVAETTRFRAVAVLPDGNRYDLGCFSDPGTHGYWRISSQNCPLMVPTLAYAT